MANEYNIRPWNGSKHYKVGERISYDNKIWKNSTGHNSTPGIGTDWDETAVGGGVDTVNYTGTKVPQIFSPTQPQVDGGSATFALSGVEPIALVSINGQIISSSEYISLSGSVQVDPINGFKSITDEVLVFQFNYATSISGGVDTVDLITTNPNPAYKEGLIFYDQEKKAVSYYNDEADITVNVSRELIVKIYNNGASTLLNGTVVKLDGGVVSDIPTAIRAQADTVLNARSLGVCTHDIEVGTTGYVTTWGVVGGLDTSAYTAGDLLFLSASVAGGLTNIEQEILKPIAAVLISDVLNGSILASQKSILNVTALGQATAGGGEAQAVTTTPVPLQVYTNSVFNQNTDSDIAGADPYTVALKPISIGASGFYETTFSISIAAGAKTLVSFEPYIAGTPTGIVNNIDLRSKDILEGSTSFSVLTQNPLTPASPIEIYVYSDANDTITAQSCIFSIKRLGNV